MATIEDTIRALEGSDNALSTLDHHHRAAAVFGMNALGLDDNGRLDFARFEGDDADGATVVGDAANGYLNDVLGQRMAQATGGEYDPGSLADDEALRLQNGYFGVTAMDVSQLATELKKDFSVEAIQKVKQAAIQEAKKVIQSAPMKLANELDKEEVLDHVGLNVLNPLYERVDVDKVEPMHMLNLLDVYRKEQTIGKTPLEQLGLYRS